MSYRTRVNGIQLFGNNESYPEWDEYIKSQGIQIGPEGEYEGRIHDFDRAMLACEAIAKRLFQERKQEAQALLPGISKRLEQDPDNEILRKKKSELERSYLDFSNYENDLWDNTQTLMDICYEIATNSYAFLPFTLFMACRDLVEPAGTRQDPDGTFRIHTYRFKSGLFAEVHAG